MPKHDPDPLDDPYEILPGYRAGRPTPPAPAPAKGSRMLARIIRTTQRITRYLRRRRP